eukprot:TRINITY_DN14118_c0_g1_i1.p1 TRINITY_DN14118_c0_g1~~TRINITY_DN14118_c0_g1_i1.p1  ORF type:complete len:468 (-),score=47.52 TRINITY_DN14118_c0_g1_i1:240-1604(-)
MAPKVASNVKLVGIKTWVRIRPLAKEGEKGHTDGLAVEKQLGDFDEESVNIINRDQGGKVQSYTYPSKVFPVDCTQEDVGNEILPGLLEDFWSDRSVMTFAYGQTGTGKTTTMFGFPESLSSETMNSGWGLLPRAVHATLEHIKQQARLGVYSVLLLSAVEFYKFMVFDLADVAGKQMCTMRGYQVFGNTYTKCDSPAILKDFIERVYGNRKVVSTKMNEGSSRSHCAMIMTLLTLDSGSRKFRQTQFSIIDLAGAERPEKALGERFTKDQAMCEIFQLMKNPAKDMSPGLQGYLINFELSNLLSEVVSATNAHKAGRRYICGWGPNSQGALAYFGGALAGEVRPAVLICLSQSPQNGWETWFSIAQYGKQLAELKTRLKPVDTIPMDTALANAEKEAAEAKKSLEQSGSSASHLKYLPFRTGMKVYTEQRLHFLRMLIEMAASNGGSGSAPET